MKMKTHLKAGGIPMSNHNETQTAGVRVRTRVKAGAIGLNHNESQAAGVRVRTRVKAGTLQTNHNEAQAAAPPC